MSHDSDVLVVSRIVSPPPSSSVSFPNQLSPIESSTSGSEVFTAEENESTDGEDDNSKPTTRVPVDYKLLFELPESRPSSHSKCLARCKICRKAYNFTLTTKGNLLKHLQTVHLQILKEHKQKQLRLLKKAQPNSNQQTLNTDGTVLARPKEPFKNQDKVVTSIVKDLCGRGGLPICTVEHDWFRDFMRLVEPKFQNISRVAVNTKLDELFKTEKRILLTEIEDSGIKPTVTSDFWTGCNTKSYMGSTVHYISEDKLKRHVLFFVEVEPPHTSENIKTHFEDQLDNCNLFCFIVVTDNAANMKHAFELLTDNENSEDYEDVSDDEEFCSVQWKPKELKVEGWLGCSAHQLQLVVNDGYSELRNYARVQKILDKAETISTLSRKSSHFAYSLSKKIPKPCPTRWSSYFQLYIHIIKNFDDINGSLQKVELLHNHKKKFSHL